MRDIFHMIRTAVRPRTRMRRAWRRLEKRAPVVYERWTTAFWFFVLRLITRKSNARDRILRAPAPPRPSGR